MGVVGSIDQAQRRRSGIGLPLAVIYKFFDDQGNYLAGVLTFYAFLAIFPLMLLATSILGFVLQGNPDLQEAALDSVLAQFPIIGEDLGRPEGLQGSAGAVVVGALGALYGAMGLGLALQNVQAVAWAVPRNSRPNPILIRLKSLLLIAVAGSVILSLSTFSAVLTSTRLVGALADEPWFPWAVRLITMLLLGMLLTSLLRLAVPGAAEHRLGRALPGGFTIAVLWQLLQYLGTVYVTRVLSSTEGMGGVFGVVLGLFGLLYIGAIMGVIGVEVNVVLARRLWPRALLTPFTDSVDLTDADRRAYAMYAQMQRHKGFETVAVRFDGRDGDTHEIVLDPRTEETIRNRTPAPAPAAGSLPDRPPPSYPPPDHPPPDHPPPDHPRPDHPPPDHPPATPPTRVVPRAARRTPPARPAEAPAETQPLHISRGDSP